jgi:hypothetical protein
VNERHPVTVDKTAFVNKRNCAIWKHAVQFIAGIAWNLYNLISEDSALIKVRLVDFPTPSH